MDEITSNKAAVPGSPQPFDRRWAVLAIIAVAKLMTALDATIVNIALPSAQHSQGFDDSGRDLCRRRRRHGMAVSRQPAGAPGALRRAGRPAGVVHHRHRRHPQLELPVLGSSVLGRAVGSLPLILILDGRRDNGAIVSGVFAEPQRPGKAIYATASGTDAVLSP
jgi:hypothetical protein